MWWALFIKITITLNATSMDVTFLCFILKHKKVAKYWNKSTSCVVIHIQGLELKLRGLSADLDQREETINRLNKEKKQLDQVNQQTLEDLQAMEDKANHLGKLKTKLEQQIEEASCCFSGSIKLFL